MKRSLLYTEDNKPATELQVLLAKDAYELKPIVINGMLFDVSLMIMKRFETAIEQWAILPKVEGYLPWMLEDSSIQLFSLSTLTSSYAEFKQKTAIRSAYLHMKASEILDAGLTYKQAKAEFQAIVNQSNA